MKKQENSIARRRRAIALMSKGKKLSLNDIVKKLKQDYQILAVRQTVANDLEYIKKHRGFLDKQSDTIEGLSSQEEELARMLNDVKDIQETASSQLVMLKAISEQKRIVKLQSELVEKRATLDIQQAEVTRPKHLIVFGQPECSSRVCPKCNALFVDNPKQQHELIKKWCKDDALQKEKERTATSEHKEQAEKDAKKRFKDDKDNADNAQFSGAE